MPISNNYQILCEDIPDPLWDDQPDFSLNKSTDLWKISIKSHDVLKEQFLQSLSQEEQERANRYHQQKDKIRYIVGKGMLRKILSHYTDCLPGEIGFKKGINNKPFLDHQIPREFNVSYSNNYILIAVSSEALGVDIEYINENFDYPMLLDSCFMEEEILAITTSSAPRKSFFRSWTRKEALLKATALGLGDYLTHFSCLDGKQSIPMKLTGDNWIIKSFMIDHAYYGSMAQKRKQPINFIDTDRFI